jgi:hypothetical protein
VNQFLGKQTGNNKERKANRGDCGGINDTTNSPMSSFEHLLVITLFSNDRTGWYAAFVILLLVNRGALRKTPLQFLHILIAHVEHGEVASLTALRSHKNAAVVATLEVALALDCAIVFACRLVEHDANPGTSAWDLGNEANVGDGAATCVGFGKEAYTC